MPGLCVTFRQLVGSAYRYADVLLSAGATYVHPHPSDALVLFVYGLSEEAVRKALGSSVESVEPTS
jgi:hypothetical protein